MRQLSKVSKNVNFEVLYLEIEEEIDCTHLKVLYIVFRELSIGIYYDHIIDIEKSFFKLFTLLPGVGTKMPQKGQNNFPIDGFFSRVYEHHKGPMCQISATLFLL